MVQPLQKSFEDIDPMIEFDLQERSTTTERPFVLSNMVTSMDGAVSVDGLSGGLGGPADFKVFMALRSLVDVIIVGAGTARAEQYKAPRPGAQAQRNRRNRGQSDRPLIVVVTASGRISPELPLFADPTYRPLVVAGADADSDALESLTSVADVARVATPVVTPMAVLDILWDRGHRVALLEGGPSLNGAFVESDCIDEWNLTLSPHLVAGASSRAAHGGAPSLRGFDLVHVWTADQLLFIQWRRRR